MIIWIASYPKSGNTWIRSMLSAYLFSEDGEFSFKLLENIDRFSIKNLISKSINDTHYQSNISKYWIPTQKIINQDEKIHFLKTHNALCTINGNKFTDQFNTKAAIYIVRDPRNLITSLAHHYEMNLGDAFNFLTNKRKIIFPQSLEKDDKLSNKPRDFNFLADWSGHYTSWKNINFCPLKIVKYEDLILDTENILVSILEFLSKFLKLKLDKKKITNTLESTSFENLSRMENSDGFHESITSPKTKKKIKFFNLGKKNNWNKLLDKKIVRKIESNFRNEMIELGYL